MSEIETLKKEIQELKKQQELKQKEAEFLLKAKEDDHKNLPAILRPFEDEAKELRVKVHKPFNSMREALLQELIEREK